MATVVILMTFHMLRNDTNGEFAESIVDCRYEVKIGVLRVGLVVEL